MLKVALVSLAGTHLPPSTPLTRTSSSPPPFDASRGRFPSISGGFSCSRRCHPPTSPSTTGARGSTTSGRGLAQGMVGSGLPTPVTALRPTPAPGQTHRPGTFACEIAQGRPTEARGRTSLARDSVGLRCRARIESSVAPRDLADGVRRMPLRGRPPRPCAEARARFSHSGPSYSPTVPRSAWERIFELPAGPCRGPVGGAAWHGCWASGPRAGGPRARCPRR